MLILIIRSHSKICPLPIIDNNTKTRYHIVVNGQILQLELMSKINILRSWDKKYVWIHTRSSAPVRCMPSFDIKLERFVTKNGKSGCQTRVRETIANEHTVPTFNYCTKCVGSPGINTTACPIATQFRRNGFMDDLKTKRNFDWEVTWALDVLGSFIDMLSICMCTTRHWQTSGRLVQEVNVCTIHSLWRSLWPLHHLARPSNGYRLYQLVRAVANFSIGRI